MQLFKPLFKINGHFLLQNQWNKIVKTLNINHVNTFLYKIIVQEIYLNQIFIYNSYNNVGCIKPKSTYKNGIVYICIRNMIMSVNKRHNRKCTIQVIREMKNIYITTSDCTIWASSLLCDCSSLSSLILEDMLCWETDLLFIVSMVSRILSVNRVCSVLSIHLQKLFRLFPVMPVFPSAQSQRTYQTQTWCWSLALWKAHLDFFPGTSD